MKFTASSQNPLQFQSGALVLPIFSNCPLEGVPASVDKELDGLLADIVENDGWKAKVGATVWVHTPQLQTPRILLLGLGEREKYSLHALRQAAFRATNAVANLNKSQFALVLPQKTDGETLAAIEGLELGAHVFDDFKTSEKSSPESVILVGGDGSQIETALVLCEANLLARKLVDTPSNLKSPASIALAAQEIARENGLKCEVWDEQKIRDEKMGALYGVGMGSDNKPRFIILEYAPAGTENDAPIALVGKGMSFDSGGYSLKPSTSMEDMKDDMAGAAVVLGAMSALAKLGVQKRVLGVVASAENMVSGNAQRPGDIVTARNGTTIEVLNTDAEGRLILADALSWTCEQNPKVIVDFATLTGAIGIALGREGAGLFSNDDGLAQKLEKSGLAVNEKLWRFPMWEEYDDYMKGDYSDLKNIASPEKRAGSIAAAVFLRHFVGENIPWAHLDIAAVSLVRSEKHLSKRGATGFGVRMILNFLQEK